VIGRSTLVVGLFATLFAAPPAAQVDQDRAAAWFREAAALCEKDGGRLWGISLCGPMVIADPVSRTIATNQRAPDTPRPAEIGYANAAFEWGGARWSAFVWQVMPADPRERGRLMMHELFHRIQPQLGLPIRDGDTSHLDTVDGRYWLQLEWRALARALAASGRDRTAALRDALAFRARRHGLFPSARESEQWQEINEGLAQYTGTVAAADSPAGTATDAIVQLEQAPRYETFVRTYAYPTGAAYGVLLDAFAPGWTRRIRGTDALGDLLLAAAQIRPADDPDAAAARYDAAALRSTEAARERERFARAADYMRRFVEGPVLILPPTNRSSSMTSGLTPLGGHGTIVRGFRTSAPWGTFEADAVLRAHDLSTYAVPAPRESVDRVLTGTGWRLELAPGWVVRPGPRDGDFRVVREPPPASATDSTKTTAAARSPERNVPAVASLFRMAQAVNAADARAYASVYAAEATITIYGGDRLEGRDAIERYEIALLRAYPGTRFALSAIWLSGSTAVVRYAVNTPAASGPATGHEGLLFYRINDAGEIAEERRYLDALTPMAQAGVLGKRPARSLPALARDPAIAVVPPGPGGANSAIVAASFAALDAGDTTGFLATLTDDVVIDELILAEAFNGRSGALAWFRVWTGAFADRSTAITSMVEIGDIVLVETVARGRLIGAIGPLPATGTALTIHRAAIFRLHAGHITQITAFMNGKELAPETRGPEPIWERP
jgi:ketosteroid isomerase-like protein